MPDLTPEALDQLEARAQKATPGPWKCWNGFPLADALGRKHDMHGINQIGPEDRAGGLLGGWTEDADLYATKADAEYVATADPTTILALIAEVRRLRFDIGLTTAHATGLEQWIESKGWCVPGGQEIKQCSETVCDCGYEGIFTEVKQLRAQVQRIRALTEHDEGYEHNGHAPIEGEPECPGCWIQSIIHALDGGAS